MDQGHRDEGWYPWTHAMAEIHKPCWDDVGCRRQETLHGTAKCCTGGQRRELVCKSWRFEKRNEVARQQALDDRYDVPGSRLHVTDAEEAGPEQSSSSPRRRHRSNCTGTKTIHPRKNRPISRPLEHDTRRNKAIDPRRGLHVRLALLSSSRLTFLPLGRYRSEKSPTPHIKLFCNPRQGLPLTLVLL